eukprot:678882-Rhodomonas_salina.6
MESKRKREWAGGLSWARLETEDHRDEERGLGVRSGRDAGSEGKLRQRDRIGEREREGEGALAGRGGRGGCGGKGLTRSSGGR